MAAQIYVESVETPYEIYLQESVCSDASHFPLA